MLNALVARVMGSLRPADGSMPAVIYKVLLPHERYRFATRQHPAVLGGRLLLVAGWAVGAVIASPLLSADGKSRLALLVWAAWLVILWRFIIKIFEWTEGYLAFSDLRLLIAFGAFRRVVYSIPLDVIDGVSFSRPLIGRFLDYGTFTLEVGGVDRVLVPFDYIPYPERTSAEIRSIIFNDESVSAENSMQEGGRTTEGNGLALKRTIVFDAAMRRRNAMPIVTYITKSCPVGP